MLCEKCKQRPAEVAVREQEGDATRELYVCKACAGEPLEKKLASMVEMIFDIAVGMAVRPDDGGGAPGDPRCAACGMTRREFRKRERLGCEACYKAFSRDTEAMIRDMHVGLRHAGKRPAGAEPVRARARLERDLKRAVDAQRYEEAARLRDELARMSRADAAAAGGGGEGADAAQ